MLLRAPGRHPGLDSERKLTTPGAGTFSRSTWHPVWRGTPTSSTPAGQSVSLRAVDISYVGSTRNLTHLESPPAWLSTGSLFHPNEEWTDSKYARNEDPWEDCDARMIGMAAYPPDTTDAHKVHASRLFHHRLIRIHFRVRRLVISYSSWPHYISFPFFCVCVLFCTGFQRTRTTPTNLLIFAPLFSFLC